MLALVREKDCLAAKVLTSLSVDLDHIGSYIEQVSPTAVEQELSDNRQPRAIRVIAIATEEAENLNSASVGPEHLLLGLLVEEENAAAQLLMNLGVKLADVRTKIAEVSIITD